MLAQAMFGGVSPDLDAHLLYRAAKLADSSAGLTAPHPNSACLIARGATVVGDGFLLGQGTTSAEVQACRKAGSLAQGATAYVNLEPGDCHGDEQALSALLQAGISRVVVGLRHPLQHFRNKAIKVLKDANLKVDVLGEDLRCGANVKDALKACQEVNAPLLYRALFKVPFSTLKYAMTLDGKIAASSGHAAWVSSQLSRQRVFLTRGRSDAVIVGGNTVRRDNPKLTTRKDDGHLPVRIVMSCSMHLPEDASLWEVSDTLTIVMTQRGARKDFQTRLEKKGVKVVEFDLLTPKAVADYCYDCGFLSLLWECGGTLAAPAISSGVVHKVMSFIAPKIIGGLTAPSPVGEMGMVEMTQALNLADVSFEQIGPDILISGYLQPIPDLSPANPCIISTFPSPDQPSSISFFQTWDAYGAFSNFSPHFITAMSSNGELVQWKSVEHYYQAHKFEGVEDPLARECVKKIQAAETPEEAARLGNGLQRKRPDLVCLHWDITKLEVMYKALYMKFTEHPNLKSLLLSTADSELVEASRNHHFRGVGREGEGHSCLGHLLMKLRTELLTRESIEDGQEHLSTNEKVLHW